MNIKDFIYNREISIHSIIYNFKIKFKTLLYMNIRGFSFIIYNFMTDKYFKDRKENRIKRIKKIKLKQDFKELDDTNFKLDS